MEISIKRDALTEELLQNARDEAVGKLIIKQNPKKCTGADWLKSRKAQKQQNI